MQDQRAHGGNLARDAVAEKHARKCARTTKGAKNANRQETNGRLRVARQERISQLEGIHHWERILRTGRWQRPRRREKQGGKEAASKRERKTKCRVGAKTMMGR